MPTSEEHVMPLRKFFPKKAKINTKEGQVELTMDVTDCQKKNKNVGIVRGERTLVAERCSRERDDVS